MGMAWIIIPKFVLHTPLRRHGAFSSTWARNGQLRKTNRITLKSAKARPASARRLGNLLDRGEPLNDLADCDGGFHSRQRHSGARVNSGRKGEMSVGGSANVEAVGERKLRRV